MTSPSNRSSRRETLAAYAQPSARQGAIALVTSVLPYFVLTVAMYFALRVSVLLTLALAIPTGAFLVRVFIMFHDCTHGSLFPSRRLNTRLGTVLGLLVLAPFQQWRHEHAVHHATAGDLDRRGVGDVPTLTIDEYYEKPWLGRVGYRLFRNPVVMFGLGPIAAMIIGPRLVSRGMRPRLRNSILATDAAIVAIVGLMCWLIGWQHFLLVWAPPALIAGSSGIWLFYVQHQFEDVYWKSGADWDYDDAALQGSSYLKLPKILQFASGNIGLHHVHHLNARIPNYNLQRAHDENEIFQSVPVLNLRDGLRSARLKLIDPRNGRLLTWAQARQAVAAPSAVPVGS